ncbi:DNA-binding transcriptional MerR regulator [Nocardia transvalensis]|uniref:DNA-binding transcriptional MerR regulator n=1 Tax=Nocardia transvalensis TaxID=37333 RepID=A0A7W9ULN5_9NOCA|nr:MerR family transcriptional regulator [Nocardia transvalensis]MBB5916905.1 DNA-binding transcriptional MerR regulator [Nocardia transvalensis]
MTSDTARSGLIGIGDLSKRTGVPVRTIRFYCDNGILDAARSSGGHRMFERGPAVERLLLVRRLRALGLGLTAIAAVLTGEQPIEQAVAAERAAVDAELGALAWRRASLAAVEHADPAERAARLELLAAVQDGTAARDTLVAFWRRILTPVPAETFDDFVDMIVPAPLADPSPELVVGFAELVALAADRQFTGIVAQQLWRADRELIRDRVGLLAGVAEACGMAEPLIAADQPPRPGRALDRFVYAHAAARGVRDTPGFRARLRHGGHDHDRRLYRYWHLTGELTGASTTAGAAQRWLFDALATEGAGV